MYISGRLKLHNQDHNPLLKRVNNNNGAWYVAYCKFTTIDYNTTTMKKIITSLMIVFYLWASNTLAHSFVMNKIATHNSEDQKVNCPYHDAQQSKHTNHEATSDTAPTGPKECYDSCLGSYDKISHTVINPDSQPRYYDWSELFHFSMVTYTTDTVTFPVHKLLSHAPPDARQSAKITKKLE